MSYGEWQAAHRIVNLRKDAFTTPGLKGWRAVTLAHVNPAEAVARFDEAAEAFNTDATPASYEDIAQRGGHWSGINQQLWAKYFRARARLVESIRTPDKAQELLDQAIGALVGTRPAGTAAKFHAFMSSLKSCRNCCRIHSRLMRKRHAVNISSRSACLGRVNKIDLR